MSDLPHGRAATLCNAGLHARVAGSNAAGGCGPCNQERALERAVDALAAAQPTVGPVIARAAIARAASTTPTREKIAAHLTAHPRALVNGDSGAPGPVRRVIAELRAAGVEGLVDPRCLDCGQPRPLGYPVTGGRVCNACEKRRRKPERCGRCGNVSVRAGRVDGVAIGSCCYVRPVHRCTVCGINRRERSYRTRRRICAGCAQRPHASCATCGLDAPAPSAPGEPARCAHCALTPPLPCTACGELTIGRARDGSARCEKCYRHPVGTCGRCGRVRAIVRMATGEDPALCAICWTGPTVTCEGCGRVRPCRGERRGRMLCSACTPVASQTCAHCHRRRRVTAHWPEGPVCGTCYQHALAAKARCPSCGQTRRLLRYPGFEEPICRHCAGGPADHVCGRCGAEDAPYGRGLCARCVLHDRLTELLGDPAARARVGINGLFDALHAARSAKDTIRWLADTPAADVLGQISRGELALTHDALDRLPPSAWLRHLEHLLMATGALPARDPALARLERWIEHYLAEHTSEPALRTFAHWIILRRARRNSRHAPLDAGVLNAAKTELRSAAAFLDWLANRDQTLAGCRQTDIDAWLANSRADHYSARSFARWAAERGLMAKLAFPAGQRHGPAAAIADQDRIAVARRLLHDPDIEARDRVAAVLIVLFAQPVSRVARLTVDDLTIDHNTSTIRLGASAITLPAPLSDHVRRLLAERRSRAAAELGDSRWLFPGGAPGRPIGAQVLSRRLKRIGVDCANARRTALLQLGGELPAALLADLLGLHIRTANKWAQIAGRPWGDYPALR